MRWISRSRKAPPAPPKEVDHTGDRQVVPITAVSAAAMSLRIDEMPAGDPLPSIAVRLCPPYLALR
jgi:hypothetical protein